MLQFLPIIFTGKTFSLESLTDLKGRNKSYSFLKKKKVTNK